MNLHQEIIKILEEEKSSHSLLHSKKKESDYSSYENIYTSPCLDTILEQILLDCEEGVNTQLVKLLKQNTSLFYMLLSRASVFANLHTNILNHIIEHRNFSLLKELINQGLETVLKDVFEKTQYNILYQDYPNAHLPSESNLRRDIRENPEWEDVLGILLKKDILPKNKVEKFSWTIINKPHVLKYAWDNSYFEHTHNNYWKNGLNKDNDAWMMIDIINSSFLGQMENLKKIFEEDFSKNGLQDIEFQNHKDCYYLPEFLIFHDMDMELKEMICLNPDAFKSWFLYRKLKINKIDLSKRIYQLFQSHDWKTNWTTIHLKYVNPWHFWGQNGFSKQTEPYLEVNSLDYALLCQSTRCYELISNHINHEGFLSQVGDDNHMPAVLKNFLMYKTISKNLDIFQDENVKKIKI